jgi:hypothetical protein
VLVLKILAKDLHKHTHSTSIFLRISPKKDIKNQPHSLWICKLEKIHQYFFKHLDYIWTIGKSWKNHGESSPFKKSPLVPLPQLPQGEGTDEVHRFRLPGGPDRAANLELPVTSYSGGWKMKMQLCAWDGDGDGWFYHYGYK